MRILIIGAGTIGITCAHLLSDDWQTQNQNQVQVLAKDPTQAPEHPNFSLNMKLVKSDGRRSLTFLPDWLPDLEGSWDLVLVTVNRLQLTAVLPKLATLVEGEGPNPEILFLMNHWCLREEVEQYLSPVQYLIGFPAFIGGGRDEDKITVNWYDEALPLGLPGEKKNKSLLSEAELVRLDTVATVFAKANVRCEYRPDMESWLKIHNLQQSVSAGAISKAGGYDELAQDQKALKEMVRAMKEGIQVCRKSGAAVNDPVIKTIERLPAGMVARRLARVFQDEDTAAMVKRHMKKGMGEWSAGWQEILETGQRLGVAMPWWEQYREYLPLEKPLELLPTA